MVCNRAFLLIEDAQTRSCSVESNEKSGQSGYWYTFIHCHQNTEQNRNIKMLVTTNPFYFTKLRGVVF
jgi:hypothetical protein